MDSTTDLVFVYGTLRKGFKFHYLLRTATLLGYAKTRERYALYVAEYPCVYKGETVSRIVGEVYEVDHVTLVKLDELEEHPYEYQREHVPVILDDGRQLLAWVYFYPRPTGALELYGDYGNTKFPQELGKHIIHPCPTRFGGET